MSLKLDQQLGTAYAGLGIVSGLRLMGTVWAGLELVCEMSMLLHWMVMTVWVDLGGKGMVTVWPGLDVDVFEW